MKNVKEEGVRLIHDEKMKSALKNMDIAEKNYFDFIATGKLHHRNLADSRLDSVHRYRKIIYTNVEGGYGSYPVGWEKLKKRYNDLNNKV